MFKVGEIVVGQNITSQPEYNGMEAEIIGGLEPRRCHRNATGEVLGTVMTYAVRWANGLVTAQEPHKLRRRKPPTTGEESIMALLKRVPHREPELA